MHDEAKPRTSNRNGCPAIMETGGNIMSDDSNWLRNPTLPRPPAVPYFKPDELDGVSASDRRIIARTYAHESRRERSRLASGGSAIGPRNTELSAATRRSA